ncbi:hypothetical protein BGZ61DRAFT_537260 [Ilyonectria robusta]|uniref:uncharacterized protein n=1 Tax=Ilyonectria robusta TaxID=1079257 RepID=UPI001E8D032D|nr:uncharacterized protein BGZ61DRAFT_537260 [Ilyonectria robusta]KAH8670610.1 hypothetical protein BGZ61DRAFT_537260 [Ilyonectria robusta]
MAERSEHHLGSSNQPDPEFILDSIGWEEHDYDGADLEAIFAEIQASLEVPAVETSGGSSQLETSVFSREVAQSLPTDVIRSSRSSPFALVVPLQGDVPSQSLHSGSIGSSRLPHTPRHGSSSMLSTRNQIADLRTPSTDGPNSTLTPSIPKRVTPISEDREEPLETTPPDQSSSFMSMNDGSFGNFQPETTDLNLGQFSLTTNNLSSLSPRNLSYHSPSNADILGFKAFLQDPHSSPYTQLNNLESRQNDTANVIHEGADFQASFNDTQTSNPTVHAADWQLKRQLLPKPSSSQHSSTLLSKPPSSQSSVRPSPVSLAVLPAKGKRKRNPEYTREKIKNVKRGKACYDVETGAKELGRYLENCKSALLDEAAMGIEDDLLKIGIIEAEKYAFKYPASAVSTAMNIRAASHFSKTRMNVGGPNVLELSYYDDSRIKNDDKVPIPAVLDYQVDYMAIQYMFQQMRLVVQRLKKLFFGPKNGSSWYEIYLTAFILLCSLESIHSRQVEVLARFAAKDDDLLPQVKATGMTMIQEWRHSVKVLIYYFRCILKGMIPFSAEWSEKHVAQLRRQCSLDEDAIAYLRRLSTIINGRETELQVASQDDLDNFSAKPLAWISRLYVFNDL